MTKKLIILWVALATLSACQYMPPPPPEFMKVDQTVSGEEVSFGGGTEAIRFYEGPRIAAQFAFWLEPNADGTRYLVACCNRRNQVVFSVYYTGNGAARVNNGPTIASETKYFLSGGTAYAGVNDKAPAAWSRCGAGGGVNICTGLGEQGQRIYHIERGRIFAGPNVQGQILMTSDNENLENDAIVSLLIPILEQRLFEQW